MKYQILSILSIILTLVNVVTAGYSTEDLLHKVSKKSTKVINLTDKNFEKYLSGPRDYHVVVLLSSQAPQFKCPLCLEFKPELELVANSWYQDHPNGIGSGEGKDIFFFYSEFLQAKEFFQKMKLNNIPKMYHLPPSSNGAKDGWMSELGEYQFFQGRHSELIIEWLRGVTDHKFNLHIPVDHTRIAINAGITLAVAILVRVFHKQAFALLTSKLIWTGLSILTILLFIAGYMFNQIRQSPYVREHPDGRVEYFVGGQQNQLGVETQIISFTYGILSILFVLLVKQVPKIQHPQVRLFAAALVSLTIYLGYSLLLCFFGKKGSGYPYKMFDLF